MRLIVSTSFFLLTCLLNQLQAQNYIPPSPDALGLARSASIPINHYTGTAGVSIPLTQVGGKELTIPISLSYSSSGIKVMDMASIVGLGWNLNAGGLITRVVSGLPDDLANGYCSSSNAADEPDIYYYNLMGQGGKFFLDRYGNAVTIPYRNIIIKPGICKYGATGIWEIIDETGTSFKFGVSTYSDREATTVTQKDNSSKTYTSSWMLSEINSPNKTEKVQFYYTSGYYTTKSVFHRKTVFPCNFTTVDLTSTISAQVRNLYGIVVSSPSGQIASVAIQYFNGRKDLPGSLYVKSITINNATEQVAKFSMEYSYFQSDGCSLAECYRLKLDKIYDLAPDPIYTFDYNTSVNLPSRYSKNFDHWGYYNNNTIDSWIPNITPSVSVGPAYTVAGASRDPDPTKMMANILTYVNERNGGSKQLNYEAHVAGNTGSDIIVGGARIKSIITNDGLGNIITKEYNYSSENNSSLSSGYLGDMPKYAVTFHLLVQVIPPGIPIFAYYYSVTSHSFKDIFDVGGIHIGYSKIEEFVGTTWKNTYYFSNFDLYPNAISNVSTHQSTLSDFYWKRGMLLNSRVYSQNVLLTSTSYNYDFDMPIRGELKSKDIFPFVWACNGESENWTYTINRQALSRPVVLKKQTQEIFDPINSSKKMTQIIDYEYDPASYQLIKTTRYNGNQPAQKYIQRARFVSDPTYYELIANECYDQYQACNANCAMEPDSQVQAYCYTDCNNTYSSCSESPSNLDEPSLAIFELNKRHQISVPVENQTLYQDANGIRLLSSTVNMFSVSGNQINPKEIWVLNHALNESSYSPTKILENGSFEKDSRLRKLQTFNGYDATTGRLLQQTSFNGIVENYVWSADGTLPLSTTVSMTGMAPRQTIYTHKPMVGQTSVVDANGNTIKYEYDVFNRLSKVKDENDHIMKQYRYHYKNETPGFRITSIKESNPGDNVIYYATDVASSVGGNPRLVWDMGDGRVVDNNSTQVSHAYSAAGTYTVKLAGLNPEYGPVTRTQQVTVYPVVSGSICADGPIYVDLCGVDDTYFEHCPTSENTQPSSPVKFTFTVSDGCASSYSYSWRYKKAQDVNWTYPTETTSQFTFYYGLIEGNFQVECTVTDGCGKSFTSSHALIRYKSNPECPDGGIVID